MSTRGVADPQSSWMPTVLPDASAPDSGARRTDRAPTSSFTRLWSAFVTVRVVVAAALFALHLVLYVGYHSVPLWLLVATAVYLAACIAVAFMGSPRGRQQRVDAAWLLTVGLDLLVFGYLYVLPPPGINYAPLFGLPVLMAAILGSRLLALGTAAIVTLLVLGASVWPGATPLDRLTAEVAQAGLTCAGLLGLSLLTNQLATRLAREEDLARRHRVEARVQVLVNNMVIENLPDGVMVVGADQMVHAANPAARALLGIEGEVTPPVFSLRDDPAWTQLMHLVRLTFAEAEISAADVTLHHPDRQSSHLQVRTQRTPAIGDDGRQLCVVFIQDLREMEARLRTEKLASMGRMSAAVAHEIRNPLAAISQANALLEEDLSNPAQRRLTAMVRQNAERLGHIVNDVLDVARVQHLGSDAAPQTVELDAFAEQVCAEWARQNGAEACLLMDLNAPSTTVLFASEHLRRVLINLLDNALRYAGRQHGSIQVASHATSHGPAMLLVWSDGKPMEPAVRRHLFEPFFSSESRSSGLGLYICRELCERHGAVIAYERTPRARDEQLVEGNEFFINFRRGRSIDGALTRPPSRLAS